MNHEIGRTFALVIGISGCGLLMGWGMHTNDISRIGEGLVAVGILLMLRFGHLP